MKKRAKRLLTVSTVLLIGGCAYALFYTVTGIGLKCPFHTLTGLYCPGCGVTHVCLSLMRLDFASAWQANPALLLLSPYFAYLLITGVYRYIKTGSKALTKTENILGIIAIAVLMLFSVLRNIPIVMSMLS